MRYYRKDSSLFIHGRFRVASTVPGSGLRDFSSIILGAGVASEDEREEKDLAILASKEGIFHDYVGFLSFPGPICICQIDTVTTFIKNGNSRLSIIVAIRESLEDAALLSVLTKTSYCAGITLGEEHRSDIIPGDFIVAMEGQGDFKRFNPDIVCASIKKGVAEILKPPENDVFFIYSRLSGGEWVRWDRGHCRFYPCHFKGQRCDYCYCPYYPCKDTSLGQWVEGHTKNQVWNCSNCTLLHEPPVAEYLKKNPCAGLSELKKVRGKSFTLQSPGQ